MEKITSSISLDTGIEQITSYEGVENAKLPVTPQLVPGSTQYCDELRALLFPPSIEQAILASLNPTIAERQNLQPAQYQKLRTLCIQTLEEEALSETDPIRKQKLDAAVNELKSHTELSDLLTTLRHLVHMA